MQNVEFKAELRDPELARAQCRLIGAGLVGTFRQQDTYYRMPDGRLKKRETAGAPVEWIFYHRPNLVRPKLSNFTILTDAQATTRWGTASLRPWLVVRKTRELWMIDNTRIHFDDVEGLGRFLEFEARASAKYSVAECHRIVDHLREQFGPALGEPISVGYCDLVDAERRNAEKQPRE
ncbi:MAG: class IV adenylate cyclase [Phycisphaeraceae bacterium]|nr:MAG: class IV adenylate cyclase [Phycisphaeraceae bacterium]